MTNASVTKGNGNCELSKRADMKLPFIHELSLEELMFVGTMIEL